MNQPIKNISIEQLRDSIQVAKVPSFRVNQILDWIYQKGVSSYDEMTNLPKSMREQLSSCFPLYEPDVVSKQGSADGTKKLLLEFHDGALVETVGLPSDNNRLTVCASSQSGCSMGCIFCATGKAGLTRSLYPGEIVDQILVIEREYRRRVTNVVVMGQGEPFSNYENTIAALRIINHPKLLNIGARHITVSTCGLVDQIARFSREPEQFTLAVSLHSAVQNTRDTLMPSLRNQKLKDLRNALIEYTELTGRRFSFEYALMSSINDSEEDLNALINYCKGLLCHVNLIPLNKVESSSFLPVSQNTMKYWSSCLDRAGVASTIRKSRGSDIAAACGQLASTHK